MSGNEGILSLGSGVSRESGKIKRGSAGEGEMGEGGGDMDEKDRGKLQSCMVLRKYSNWLSWL